MKKREDGSLFLALHFGTLILNLIAVLSFKGFFIFPTLSAMCLILTLGFAVSYFRLSENHPSIKHLRNALLVAALIISLRDIILGKKDTNIVLSSVLLWTMSFYSLALLKDRDYILMRWMSGIGIIVSSTLGGTLVSMRYYSIAMIAMAFLILVVLFRVDFIRDRLRYLSLVYEEKGFEKKRSGGLLTGGSFTSFCAATFLIAYLLAPKIEHVIYRAIPQDLARDPKPKEEKILGQQDLKKGSRYLYIKPSQLTARIGNSYNIRAFYAYGAEKDKKRDVTNLVEWSVEDLGIATIYKGGILKGLRPGLTKIRCAYKMADGILMSGPVEVLVGLSSIELNPRFGTVSVGKTLRINTRGIFEDGSSMDLTGKVVWESNKGSNEKAIATVLNNATLAAHHPGLAEIRAIRGRDDEGDVVKSPISYIVITDTYPSTSQKGEGAINIEEPLFSSSHPGYWRSLVYDQYGGSSWYVSEQALSDLKKKDNKFYSKSTYASSSEKRKVVVNCLINQDMAGIIPQFGNSIEEIVFPEIYKGVMKSDESGNLYLIPEFVLQKGLNFEETALFEAKMPSLDFPLADFKNYTTLPEGLPKKVLEKAKDLVRDEIVVNKIVEAIDKYIFDTCVIDPKAEPPKDSGDITEYALFSGKPCTIRHLAAAQAVMYRAAGIPSRLAVGFAGFSQNSKSGRYDIYESSRSAWPQIYIKDYGWVDRFPDILYKDELAKIRPSVDAKEENVLKKEPGEEKEKGAKHEEAKKKDAIIVFIKKTISAIAVALTPIGFIFILFFVRKKTLERMIALYPKEAIKVFYRRFAVRMKSFNFAFDRATTPFELCGIVSKITPALEAPVTELTLNYLEAGYSSHDVRSEKAAESLNSLRMIEEYMDRNLKFINRLRSKFLYPVIYLSHLRGRVVYPVRDRKD